MEAKACSRCRETKPLDQFYTKLGKPSSWCKTCTLAEVKARYRSKHPEPPPYQPPAEKACNKCGETKPLEQFHRRRSARDGRNSICAACSIADATAWNKAHPEYHREKAREYAKRHPDRKADIGLKWKYGISWGTYDKMLAEQGGKCGICGTTTPSARTNRFHVDHDKETGIVRGLLCSCCNTGIGQMQHSQSILLSAIEYLRKYSESN